MLKGVALAVVAFLWAIFCYNVVPSNAAYWMPLWGGMLACVGLALFGVAFNGLTDTSR